MKNDDSISAGDPAAAAPKGGFREFWRQRKLALFWWALIVALALIVLWPSVIITIKPGHVGALYRRFLGGTVMDTIYQEGTHIIFPWDTMYLFDARLHEEMHTLTVLNTRGLRLDLDVTVIYHPLASKVPTLLTTVGADYREKLVIPMMTAAVRDIAAKYDTDDFFSASTKSLSDEMLVSMISTMGRNPVIVDNLLIRRVHLPEALGRAIDSKLVAQQKVFEQRFVVQQAVENYKRKYIDASAVSMTQQIVNERMNEAFLRWQGIEATRALAESVNSKVVLFGGKDGLPVILNLEGGASGQAGPGAPPAVGASPALDSSMATSVAPAAGASPPTPVQTTGPPASNESWLDIISQERLEQLSKDIEKAISIPLYNHGPDPAPTDRQGERP